ncbi:MAG: hypothetical protein RDV41_08325 [Planctomycetota bacterium]|nr:hypothetical protein [Planctomycetota bacterium]
MRSGSRHGVLQWKPTELALLKKLRSPAAVQAFLDTLPYSADDFSRCPRSVIRDGKANCYDGALFAAAALRRLGFPPLILNMRAVRDDDHVIAPFRRGSEFGAVAKSNFVGLRFRDPVYKSLRELVMSYFDDFYNTAREKTLRAYSMPLDLRPFDRFDWMTTDGHVELIADKLDAQRHVPVLPRGGEARLVRTDDRSFSAGLLGANAAGLYKVPGS